MMTRSTEMLSQLVKARLAGVFSFSVTTLLSPPLARSLSPYIMIPGILGEVSLTLWLLVAGVNVPRWNEQAGFAFPPTR